MKRIGLKGILFLLIMVMMIGMMSEVFTMAKADDELGFKSL